MLFRNFRKLGWNNDEQSTKIFEFLMELRVQLEKDDILIDLGAGQCRYKFMLDNCNYIGVDLCIGDKSWDFSRIDIAGDIIRADFIKDNCADYILNTSVLEHINEPEEMLSHIYRVLKPGGKLYLYVPFVIPEHQIPYDFYRYTSYGLRCLIEKVGLNPVYIKPSNNPLYTGIRFANYSLDYVTGNIFIKAIKLVLKGIIMASYPFFDLFAKFCSISTEWPVCWLLIAQKPGVKIKSLPILNRNELINRVITCPKCKNNKINLDLQGDSYLCPKCCNKFEIKNGTIFLNNY